jgi:hypothetical protein
VEEFLGNVFPSIISGECCATDAKLPSFHRRPMTVVGVVALLIESANTSKTRSTRSSVAFCPISPTRQIRPAVGPNPPAISTRLIVKQKRKKQNGDFHGRRKKILCVLLLLLQVQYKKGRESHEKKV